MSKQASNFQKKVMSLGYRGKEIFKPLNTGWIDERVACVREWIANIFFYTKNGTTIMIDAGYNYDRLKEKMGWLDIDPAQIRHILITHQDTDHVGAVERDSDLLSRDAVLYLSETENRYLTGEVRRKVVFGAYKLPMVKTDNRKVLLKDGQILDIDGIKIECILCPGHTWGHMVYLIDDEYLFTGDTIWFGADGGYSFINSLAEDNELAKRSLVKLENNLRERNLSPKVITGHTGWSEDLDFVFAHKDQVCNSLKKQKPHDPSAPYDGYDEREDTEEKARHILLASVNDARRYKVLAPETGRRQMGISHRRMKKIYYSPSAEGFYGAFYECPVPSEKAVILMLGDAVDDRMAVCGAKWLHRQGCHVMAMAPDRKDYGHHNYPLERFGKVIGELKEKGCSKIGIIGASTTGMMALLAASYYPEISLTIAISPPDFVMEGFYQDGKDGMRERPGDNESSVSWEGKPLPYLPYAYRHPEYWLKIKEASKAGKDMVASRPMFDESEKRHPVQEEEKIKVENIHGKVLCIGAEDDVLWDTCKYIWRMEERLQEKPHNCKFKALLYEHGTHFAFPESMLKMMLPVGGNLFVGAAFRAGREYPKECRETRKDIDRKLKIVFEKW